MQGMMGVFRELDAATETVRALRAAKINKITAYTPTPRHEFEEAFGDPPSNVRKFTLIGGLLGATFGWWIAIWCSTYWPLVVGGKAIASWVPYTIFGFEGMVLIGGLSTVFGMLSRPTPTAPPNTLCTRLGFAISAFLNAVASKVSVPSLVSCRPLRPAELLPVVE